jgi:hypothetical protein
LRGVDRTRVKTHYFREPRCSQNRSARQEKGEERIGNTVEPFDEPGGDFHCNPKGRGPFGRRRRCSSLMIE